MQSAPKAFATVSAMATAPALRRPSPGQDEYGTPGRAAWLDVDWREHSRFATVGGRRLHYVDVGDGPPLLMLHGLGACWTNWLENLPHFAERYRVIVPDFPGFGWSEMPADEDISISLYARGVHELCEQLDIARAPVLGHSMGGFVGSELAIRHPERVECLVLVAAAVLWRERRRARPLVTLAQVGEASTAWLASHWEWAHRRPRLRYGALINVVRHPLRLSPELTWELMRRTGSMEGFTGALRALHDYDMREHLTRIACPTLVVWGRQDQLVPVDQARIIEELVPDARRVIFDDTGHCPNFERPARFDALVDEFLAEGRASAG